MQDNECADRTMNALAAVSHPSHLFLEFWVLRRQNVDFMYDIVVVCPILICFYSFRSANYVVYSYFTLCQWRRQPLNAAAPEN